MIPSSEIFGLNFSHLPIRETPTQVGSTGEASGTSLRGLPFGRSLDSLAGHLPPDRTPFRTDHTHNASPSTQRSVPATISLPISSIHNHPKIVPTHRTSITTRSSASRGRARLSTLHGTTPFHFPPNHSNRLLPRPDRTRNPSPNTTPSRCPCSTVRFTSGSLPEHRRPRFNIHDLDLSPTSRVRPSSVPDLPADLGGCGDRVAAGTGCRCLGTGD